MEKKKNIFNKISRKAEKAIDDVVDDTKQLLNNGNDLVKESKTRLQVASYLIAGGFVLTMVANICTIVVCSKVSASIHKNDIMQEILRALRSKA